MRKVENRRKRKIRKKVRNLFCVCFLVILLLQVRMVDAGSNDSVIEKNRVDNLYAVTNLGGVNRIFYLNMYTMNGRIAYCIELGVDITSDIYNSTYDFGISNLGKEKINYIKNVSYFGYGYNNQNDVKYYMATQEIIWEYLGNVEVEWTNVLDVSGERINIDSYKNEILNLVNDYYKGINLENYTSNMEVDIGERLVIINLNDNLDYYDVISGEHCSVRIDGSSIYVKFDTDYVGEDNIILKRKGFYSYNSSLYYQGDSQKLISNGNIEEEIKLNFSIKGKKMPLQLKDDIDIKKNGQYNYLGIKFELFNSSDKFLGVVESDEMGRISVKNLPYGDYYAKQVRNNLAYHMDFVRQDFTFYNEEDVILLNVEPIINKIKVLKFYGEGENLKEESGVTFDVYNIDGSYYDSFVTDDDGIGIIDVPYGEYQVKQKNSSYGYAKVEDFYVDGRGYSKLPFTYNLVDQIIKSSLIINSKDLDDNLIKEDGISYRIKKDNNYLEFDGVNEFKSIDGVLTFPFKIDYGKYVIEIIDDSTNYQNDMKEVVLNIDDNSDFKFIDGEFWINIDINYSLKKSKVSVNTYKEKVFYEDISYYYDYVKNSNVKLELVANRDIVINKEVIYKSGDKIAEIVTDENGEYLISDIYLGDYCLVDINNNRQCFQVVDDKSLEITIKNDLSKGGVIVHNISSEMEDINGTVMELINTDKQIIYSGITNDEGIIKINDLVEGKYCFIQKSVNTNYLINDNMVCFSIVSNEVVDLEVVNKKNGKQLIIVPNTFSDKKNMRKFIVLLGMLLGGIIYKIKIRIKSN